MSLNQYNIRVYGLLVNSKAEVLLSREHRFGKHFTKFPGGGHELGEGIADCLKREFQEELGIEVHNLEHFYTTDFFVPSFFDSSTQVLSIYYRIKQEISKDEIELEMGDEKLKGIKWISLTHLTENNVTFPIDKHVVSLLKKKL